MSQGLCSGSYYGDPYAEMQYYGGYATAYTPGLEEATMARRGVFRAHATRSYPQDMSLPPHGGYYYEEGGEEEEPVEYTEEYHESSGVDYDKPFVTWSSPDVEPTGVVVHGGGFLEKGAEAFRASELIHVSRVPSKELAGTVIDTEYGPYLLTDDVALGEMAREEPSSEVEGTVIITSDDRALTLVSEETIRAENNGEMPADLERLFSELMSEEEEVERFPGKTHIREILVTPEETEEGEEEWEEGEEEGEIGGEGVSMPDLSSNVAGQMEKVTANASLHEMDAMGNIYPLNVGIRYSFKRRKFKKGRRGRSQEVKEARAQAKRERRALASKKKERARLARERRQLSKRRKQIEELRKREAREEEKLKSERARFERESRRYRQLTTEGGGEEELGPELPPRDEYRHYYSGAKYSNGERVEPKTISFAGKGEVTVAEPKDSKSLGKRFHKHVWGLNDAAFDLVESQALEFFKDYYGFPVEKAVKGKDGVYRMGDNFEIAPYGVKSGINMVASNIQGFSKDAKAGASVHEGGWKLTLHKSAKIGGEYGGDAGKDVKKGAIMKWGHWHIANDDNRSVHPRILVHFESTEPCNIDDAAPLTDTIKEHYYVDYVDPVAIDDFVYAGDAYKTMSFTPDKLSEAKGHVALTTHINFDQ